LYASSKILHHSINYKKETKSLKTPMNLSTRSYVT
jgi:hypothetical protein